jgi:uracil-DNA glycosylase family protein
MSHPSYPGARPYLPTRLTLPALREAVTACHGCPLYQHATHAVLGEGPEAARAVFVGEVPGDVEDREARPFVGPAGHLLDEAFGAAGISRDEVYLTNAVKHFKYTMRGKRRIHDKPDRYEIEACKPWIAAELEILDPEIVVVLGATAAQALLSPTFRVTRARGQFFASKLAPWTLATVHPASVLRAPDREVRAEAREAFFADIARVGERLHDLDAPGPTASSHRSMEPVEPSERAERHGHTSR